MKVCFTSLYAYGLFQPSCAARFGGSEVQLYTLSRELAKDKNFEVHFITGDFGQPRTDVFTNVTVHRGCSVQRKLKYLSGIPAAVRFFRILKAVDADVYILRSAGIEAAITALYCRVFHKTFIHMTASSIDCGRGFRKKGLAFFYSHLYAIHRADSLIAQNENQQTDLKKNFGLTSVLIRNSFPLYSHYTKPATKKGLLWVSSCQALKQPELFVELARAFSEEPCTFILPPNPYHKGLFERMKEMATALPNLHLIPGVPFHEIDRYFEQSRIFVNTSIFEGFPNTFVQAARSRTPIISLNVNPDDFLGRYECGFCAEGDLDRLIEYARRLLADDTLQEKMGDNAFTYASENHDVRKNIELLKHVLRQSKKD